MLAKLSANENATATLSPDAPDFASLTSLWTASPPIDASTINPFDETVPETWARFRMLASRMDTPTPTADPLGLAADPSAVAVASVLLAVVLNHTGPRSAVTVKPPRISASAVVFVRLIANAAATEIEPDWFDSGFGVLTDASVSRAPSLFAACWSARSRCAFDWSSADSVPSFSAPADEADAVALVTAD